MPDKPHDKSNRARLTLWLVFLLAGSNLATAIGAYLVIDRISGRYIQEINSTAPGMHDIMLLAQKSTNVHRAAAVLLIARDPAEETRMLSRLDVEREKELALRNHILNTVAHTSGRENTLHALASAASDYETTLLAYLQLVKSGQRSAAQDFRLSDLRTAFERYQQAQQEESVRLNLEAMRGGAELGAYADKQKSWLLGIGTWPLVMLTLTFIGLLVLGAMVWGQIRRLENSDSALTKPGRLRF
jgi:hypothetical protein